MLGSWTKAGIRQIADRPYAGWLLIGITSQKTFALARSDRGGEQVQTG